MSPKIGDFFGKKLCPQISGMLFVSKGLCRRFSGTLFSAKRYLRENRRWFSAKGCPRFSSNWFNRRHHIIFKVLAQTNETKLTLILTLTLDLTLKPNLTLTLTLLNPNICVHIVDTHKCFFPEFIIRVFCARWDTGLWVRQTIALPAKIRRWLI